jgi:hypothetical protein
LIPAGFQVLALTLVAMPAWEAAWVLITAPVAPRKGGLVWSCCLFRVPRILRALQARTSMSQARRVLAAEAVRSTFTNPRRLTHRSTCHLVCLQRLQGLCRRYRGRLFQPRRYPSHCSSQQHLMSVRTEKPQLFGIKRLVGMCRWHLRPQGQ